MMHQINCKEKHTQVVNKKVIFCSHHLLEGGVWDPYNAAKTVVFGYVFHLKENVLAM